MKTTLHKSVKNYLLEILCIADYFKAAKYGKKHWGNHGHKQVPHDVKLPGLFIWEDTPEGKFYWGKLSHRTKYPVKQGWFTLLLKRLIKAIPFLMLIVLVSCSKEKQPPIPKTQRVFYEVQCADCLVTLQDDKWNDNNELDRSKSQSFNVTGKFKYTFDNTSLSSVKFEIYVSVFAPKQQIFAKAYTNDGHIVDLSGWYGLDYPKDNPLHRDTTLILK